MVSWQSFGAFNLEIIANGMSLEIKRLYPIHPKLNCTDYMGLGESQAILGYCDMFTTDFFFYFLCNCCTSLLQS